MESETAFLFQDDWDDVNSCELFTVMHWDYRAKLRIAELHKTISHHLWCVKNCSGRWSSFRQGGMHSRLVTFTFNNQKDAAAFYLRFSDDIVFDS